MWVSGEGGGGVLSPVALACWGEGLDARRVASIINITIKPCSAALPLRAGEGRAMAVVPQMVQAASEAAATILGGAVKAGASRRVAAAGCSG